MIWSSRIDWALCLILMCQVFLLSCEGQHRQETRNAPRGDRAATPTDVQRPTDLEVRRLSIVRVNHQGIESRGVRHHLVAIRVPVWFGVIDSGNKSSIVLFDGKAAFLADSAEGITGAPVGGLRLFWMPESQLRTREVIVGFVIGPVPPEGYRQQLINRGLQPLLLNWDDIPILEADTMEELDEKMRALEMPRH